MSDHRLLVFSNPVPGREAEFNAWYTEVHIHDLLKAPGVRSAQRHQVLQDLSRKPLAAYVAEYRIESPDLGATFGEIRRRLGTADMPMSDAFDRTTSTFMVLEAVAGPRSTAAEVDPAANVKAVSFVASNPVAGLEAAYATWYDGTHIGDLLQVPGYRHGQRFRVLDAHSRNTAHRYLARYEIETPDLADTMSTARARLGTPAMVMDDSFDMGSASFNLTRPLTECFARAA